MSELLDKISLMEWLIGLSATALGGLIAAGSSWLSARYQANAARDRWKDEAGERHENAVREALAEVLSHRPALVQALNEVLVVKYQDRLVHANSDVQVHISDGLLKSTDALMSAVRPFTISLERVWLLTTSDAVVVALKNLEDAVGNAGTEASKVAKEQRHIVEYNERRTTVSSSFHELKKVARRECARTPSE